MNEPDAWRTACILLEECGDAAEKIAAKRAEALIRLGDMDRATDWIQIILVILELKTKRSEAERIN